VTDATRAAATELLSLVENYREAGRDDAAWCAAHAGCVLLGEAADQTIRDLAEQYRPQRPRKAEAPINEQEWFTLLAHGDDDPFVSKVFECALSAVRSVRSVALSKAGLHQQDAVHPSRSSVAVVRAMGAAAFALDVPIPLAFVVPAKDCALDLLPTEPIATVAGSRVTAGRSVEELAFIAGYHMAHYRSVQYVRALYSDSVAELTTLFAATLRAARPSLSTDPSVAKIGDKLRAILAKEPQTLARLERVVALFVERGAPVDIQKWIQGAQRTCLRAGLLLCGDLNASKTAMMVLDHLPADGLADLTRWAMSEQYFELRQKVGIALWPDRRESRVPDLAMVREVTTEISVVSEVSSPARNIELIVADADRRAALRGAISNLNDPGEATEVAKWIALLEPALREAFARTPEDFDAFALSEGVLFADELRLACELLGIDCPLVAPTDDLGHLWSAPPCSPPLILLDVARDQELDHHTRRWLAMECAATFIPSRMPLRWAPTPGMLAEAVAAVAARVGHGQSLEGAGTAALSVETRVLGSDRLVEALSPLAKRISAEVFRNAALRWAHAVERGAVRYAAALCADRTCVERVCAARPFRPGALDHEAWRECVHEVFLDPATDLILLNKSADFAR
jgi:hypothetical protein